MIRIFTSKTQQLGQIGEEKAKTFLVKHGFGIIAQNIHNRHGEIDIVAKKDGIYHFFEVKAGKQGSWFNPADNLTKEKLWKFHRAVEYYALKRGIKDYRIQAIVVRIPYGMDKETTFELLDIS
jgi:putative endonuclease